MRVLVSVQTGLGNAILKTPALACLAEEMGDVAVDFSGGEEFGASKVFCGWARSAKPLQCFETSKVVEKESLPRCFFSF